MNQIIWEEILKEALSRGMPLAKKRAILREYLQVKFLTGLYRLPGCFKLAFIGGTSLRLLRGLNRFSEDLDFDNFDLSVGETKSLFEKAAQGFEREGIGSEFDFKKSSQGGYGRLRFPRLLSDLKISRHPREKLMIRLDFTFQPRVETEVVLLTRFGMSERVVTNTLPVLLAQKARALLSRKQTRGRDFYDLYWFLSREVKPDLRVLGSLKISSQAEFKDRLRKKYQKEEKRIAFYQRQIRPFLLKEEEVSHLDFLKDLLTR